MPLDEITTVWYLNRASRSPLEKYRAGAPLGEPALWLFMRRE